MNFEASLGRTRTFHWLGLELAVGNVVEQVDELGMRFERHIYGIHHDEGRKGD